MRHSLCDRRLLTFPKLPPTHGNGADAPLVQYEPSGQSTHAIAPLSFMKVPAPQSAHSFCPVAGCTVPGEHGLWASEPVEHDEPAGHEVHWPLLPSPGALLNEPSEHGNGALLPASQYEPATQSKHSSLPLSFMNLPATHSAHSFWPTSGCTVPGLHSL